MSTVGFSTGCLYKSGLSIDDIIEFFLSHGAKIVELSFATPKELLDYNLTEYSINNLKKFQSVSIHAPWKGIEYSDNEDTNLVIDRLREISNLIEISGIVLHPDVISDFGFLNSIDLPFLIENMNSRKTFGTQAEDFIELRDRYNFGFVLDIQHAYELDKSMNLALEFIKVMGHRLKHMHVSGCNLTNSHLPTFCSQNRESIVKVLEYGIDVPKILEGMFFEDKHDSIDKELEFVGNFEKTI